MFKVGDYVVVIDNKTVVGINWLEGMNALLEEGVAHRVEDIFKMPDACRISGVWVANENLLKTGGGFKKGDKVVVVSNHTDGGAEDNPGFVDGMVIDPHKEFTVVKENRSGYICLEECRMVYHREWLVLANHLPSALVKPKRKKKTSLMQDAQAARTNDDQQFAMENEKGQRKVYSDPPCYARVKYDFKKLNELIFMPPKEQSDVQKDYVRCIFQCPSIRASFNTNTYTSALRSGIRANVDKPLSQILFSAITIREGFEKRAKLKLFAILRKEKGIAPEICYLLSTLFTLSEGDRKASLTFSSGHTAMEEASSIDDMMEFFKKGFPDKGEKPTRESCTSYSIAASVEIKGGGIRETSAKWFPTFTKAARYGSYLEGSTVDLISVAKEMSKQLKA